MVIIADSGLQMGRTTQSEEEQVADTVVSASSEVPTLNPSSEAGLPCTLTFVDLEEYEDL